MHLYVCQITLFSCGHIVPKENILPIVLEKGPTGRVFNFSFQNRDSPEVSLSKKCDGNMLRGNPCIWGNRYKGKTKAGEIKKIAIRGGKGNREMEEVK